MNMLNANPRLASLKLILCFSFAMCPLNSCSWRAVQTQKPSGLVSSPMSTSSQQGTNKSRVRFVDFSNFEYPAKPIYSDGELTFRLRDGKFEGRYYPGVSESETVYLSQKVYGDVTGDGVEEAILVLLESVRGSAIPYYVYIYTLDGENPRLLWSFGTGDRADGGLRRAYSADGNLIVELYGKGTVVDANLKDQDELGACCPQSFTQTVYEWDGNKFRQKGPSEVIADRNASGDLLPSPKN